MNDFSTLGLAEPLLRALAAKKYATATPIQSQCIPNLLTGKDLCGIAQTGTGKTAAFALPSLHRLSADERPTPIGGCRMLVLSPTRELAAQIAQSFRDYGRFMSLTVETVFGGVPIHRQITRLRRGVDILVATPGRLLDLIDQRALTLKDVEIFVLDEADQMMDLGFIVPLKRITKLLPRQRQSLFFSATMPRAIEDLASQFLTDPVKVSVAPQSTTAERVRQIASYVNHTEKQALLTHLLRADDIDRALIFTRTKHGADRVVRFLIGAGIQAAAIHGNKSQAQRTTALQAFRAGTVRFLVATDIAARGIDVSGVSHVFNFELPNVAEQYVHRIGRTARAGAEGVAISLVADDERAYLRAIEKVTRMRCEIAPLPEGFAEMVRNLPKPAAAPARGPSRQQTPDQQARRREGQRQYETRQRGGSEPRHDRSGTNSPSRNRDDRPAQAVQGDRPDRGARPQGDSQEQRRFQPRRRGGVGAHKNAVRKTAS